MAFRGGYHFRHFEGAAKPLLFELPVPGHVSFFLDDPFLGACVPAVGSGTVVRAGEVLLSADDDTWSIPAPISGTVILNGDGFLRTEGNKSAEFLPVPGHTREPWLLERGELFRQFSRAGAGMLFGNCFHDLARCDAVTDIIINTIHTSPLNGGWSPELYGAHDLASRGLKILKALFPPANIALTATRRNAGMLSEHARESSTVKILSDKYPQEHPALLAREIAPGCSEGSLLIADYTDVVQLAETLCLGRPLIDRIVCIAGPGVSRPGWYRIRIGTSLAEILKQVGKDRAFGPWRVILGNPLSGKAVENPDEPLTFGVREISVISDFAERELLAFIAPGFTEDSYSRTTVSSVLPFFPRKLETNMHGGVRPCIQCNFCDEVCPAGMYPFLIWKYMSIDKPEETVRLRPGDCIDCGLCDYVCPSKISILDGVKRAREALAKKDQE